MARLSSANVSTDAPDHTAVNLSRLLARLQQNLYSPDLEVESKLRKSSLERERVGNNLEYARGLILKLEQDAINIKVQSKKVETQTELVRKKEVLQKLSERLDELNEFAEPSDDDSSEGEDLLGEDTPSETTDEQGSPMEEAEPILDPVPTPISREHSLPTPTAPSDTPAASTLRSRQTADAARTELFSSRTTGSSISPQTANSSISPNTEALLTHNRIEQEAITNSLLSMATALKESSKAFGSSLEAEKTTLDRAVEGLDKNELGLEAASRSMGHLRNLTEGKGWWGRMLLYAYIAGLAVLAILLVFVGPKLRF